MVTGPRTPAHLHKLRERENTMNKPTEGWAQPSSTKSAKSHWFEAGKAVCGSVDDEPHAVLFEAPGPDACTRCLSYLYDPEESFQDPEQPALPDVDPEP